MTADMSSDSSLMVRSETIEMTNPFLHPGDKTLNSTLNSTLNESMDKSLNDTIMSEVSTASAGSETRSKKRSQRKQSTRTKNRKMKERWEENSKNTNLKEREVERIAKLRKDKQKKLSEMASNRETKQLSRQKSKFREDEQRRNTEEHRERRENEEYRNKEQRRNTEEHRGRRENEEYRNEERRRDTQEHRKKREDEEYRNEEQRRNTEEHRARRANIQHLVSNYETTVKEGPVYICICCGGLFFKRTVKEFNESTCRRLLNNDENYRKATLGINHVCEAGKKWYCITCERHIQAKKIPKIALGNGLQFLNINSRLEMLNELEERLISPRIPFIRIRTLGYDSQKSIRGNVVNVPVDTNETLKFLPRRFNESKIIQLKFMRKMSYNTPYMYDKINPAKMVTALQYLVNKPLFTKINMKIRMNWQISQFTDTLMSEQNFIVEEDDRIAEQSEQANVNNNNFIGNNKESETDSETEDRFVANSKTFENQETLIYNSVDAYNKDKQVEDQTIAPAEGRLQIHFLTDPHNEELCFLKIYGGEQIIPYLNDNTFTYSSICKSELRRFDRRCATNMSKIFYMYKKLVAKNLLSSIDTAMKKTKNTEKLTVRDVKNKEKMNELLLNSEAQLMLRANRSTPQFWEWKKMEINAMIRQLGCPTFFITFSPDEENWIDLLIIVTKALENKTITRVEALSKSKPERYDLLSKDPVTVARYFENRMTALFKLIFNENTVFAENPNTDYFWRVDFQYRGSPHIHLLAWMKDAPKYSKDNDDTQISSSYEYIQFIDKYITCERPLHNLVTINIEDQNKSFNMKCQFHKHKANCKLIDAESGHVTCKYGFPWPILEETCILEPLKKHTREEKEKQQTYADYFQILRLELEIIAIEFKNDSEHFKEMVDLNTLLERLTTELRIIVTKDVYLDILRSSITRSTVFLKRNCRELMLNPYNKFIICHHRANMDIQFITDPYGAAAYVSAYMLKANAVMSATLKKAQIEIQQGNLSIRKRLLALANVFHNSSEIGAQEAVFTLLSMPVSKSSRSVVYINTYKSKDRNRILKEQRYLDLIDDNSTDIYRTGILDYYKMRPADDKFQNMCLAEYASYYDRVSKVEMDRIKKARMVKKLPIFPDDLYEEDEDDFLDENNDKEDYIPENYAQQRDRTAYVRRRTNGKILRYKRYNRKRDTENWMRVQVMLYYPWKEDETELEINENCDQIFMFNMQIIGNNRAKFETVIADDFDDAVGLIEQELQQFYDDLHDDEAERNQRAHNILMADSEFLDPNVNNYEIEQYETEHGFQTGIVNNDDDVYRHNPEMEVEGVKMPTIWTQDYYREFMKKLNRLQQCIHHNIHGRIQNKETFNIFLTGASGTGKSAVLKAVYQTVWRTLKPTNPNTQFPVIVGAYTGKAAFNVKGLTLHSLFRLPTKGSKIGNLSSGLLLKCQKTFEYTLLIIIDEISLVSCSTFDSIVKRLLQVKEVEIDNLKISFLVVGDFRQLQPVNGKWIFETNSKYSNIFGNLNWSKFEFFELTEVMRQREDKIFAETLTTIGDLGIEFCNQEQIDLLDSRIVSATLKDIPDEAIILCHSNKNVQLFNGTRLTNCEKIINIANDHAMGRQAYTEQAKQKAKTCKDLSREDTNNLPYELTLVLGKKYMLTSNLNVSDGIANGTVGILKKIIPRRYPKEGESAVIRVYLQFEEKEIGMMTRAKNVHEVADDICQEWTVIESISPEIKRPAHGNYHIEREQLPLVECEAMTIHKSQGQTYNTCAVNLAEGLTQRLLYVALSRCTKLEGLYLFGAESIRRKKLTENALTKLREVRENTATQKEVRRLRTECQLVNKYPFIEESYEKPILDVMFVNIENYGREKVECVQSDIGFMSCDIIMLCECHFNLERLRFVQLDGYRIVKATGRRHANGSYGQICYFKDSHENGILDFVGHNGDASTDLFSDEKCELSMFFYRMLDAKPLYLISAYNHQAESEKQKINNFKNAIDDFIESHFYYLKDMHIMMFGDFNIDFNSQSGQSILKHLKDKYGLVPTLTNVSTRFRSGNKKQLDYVFTNMPEQNQETKLYTSWFTDHSPLYTAIHNLD